MTKLLTLFFLLTLGLNGFTQISFVRGYYINNSNEKTDCLIKNVGWLNNPTEFKYKITENSDLKTLSIKSVKEFGIINESKYVRHSVNIDRSSYVLNELGYDKNPIFNIEELFLKVLVEGKANLYLYEDRGLVRYFFNKNLTDVTQLIYKAYLADEGQVVKNNQFRRQLWNTLKCESISIDLLEKINYRQSELIKFFIKYNECSNSEFINYEKKQKKDLFNLTLRPGVRSSSLVLKNDQYVWKEIDFGKGLTSFRFGLEAEFILGFNNNKWSLILEPTYQHFESENMITYGEITNNEIRASIDYTSIDVNLGLRYYMFLNNDLKFFANICGAFDNSFNSLLEVSRNNAEPFYSAEVNAGVSLVYGVGCKYKERYNLELRYFPKRNILNASGSWGTEFTSVSILLGYSMF